MPAGVKSHTAPAVLAAAVLVVAGIVAVAQGQASPGPGSTPQTRQTAPGQQRVELSGTWVPGGRNKLTWRIDGDLADHAIVHSGTQWGPESFDYEGGPVVFWVPAPRKGTSTCSVVIIQADGRREPVAQGRNEQYTWQGRSYNDAFCGYRVRAEDQLRGRTPPYA
jgi:hypothetical protein